MARMVFGEDVDAEALFRMEPVVEPVTVAYYLEAVGGEPLLPDGEGRIDVAPGGFVYAGLPPESDAD
jgi:hypothetical protein